MVLLLREGLGEAELLLLIVVDIEGLREMLLVSVLEGEFERVEETE